MARGRKRSKRSYGLATKVAYGTGAALALGLGGYHVYNLHRRLDDTQRRLNTQVETGDAIEKQYMDRIRKLEEEKVVADFRLWRLRRRMGLDGRS